jgi:hexosaminidase
VPLSFGWRGTGNAGYNAGKQGNPFVLTPAQTLYLIRYQGPQWFEPRTYFGNNTLKDVYEYEPVQPDWEPEVVSRLLGIQGSLWSEFITTSKEVEYLLYPRLTALAEVAWSPKGTKDWPDFLKRMDVVNQHYANMDVDMSRSMYNLDHHISGTTGNRLKVVISCIRPDVEIRYTTDQSDPGSSSLLFQDSIILPLLQLIYKRSNK